jgi:cytochrome c-type biogenesis protein CcmE
VREATGCSRDLDRDAADDLGRIPGAAYLRLERILSLMNKRARNRLIGVTAIILILAAVLLVTLLPSGSSYTQTVKAIATDSKLVGTRVKVTGTVVPGSWDKKTNPMVFKIRDEGTTAGAEATVTYNGSAPNTFGSGTVAILTGTVDKLGAITANEMLTKCPSKYQTTSDSATVADLLSSPSGTPMRVSGYLKPSSLKDASAATRFVLATTASGTGKSVPVAFTGAMPSGTKDGVQIVVFGKLTNGTFVASDVSLAQ